MNSREAVAYAATWGSYMRDGDPGACMYGFGDEARPQSEDHRRNILAFLDNHCAPVVAANPGDYEPDEAAKMAEFRAFIEAAPIEGESAFDKADPFTKAYITTALWTGVEPPEDHEMAGVDKLYDLTPSDLDSETLAAMIEDCRKFQQQHGAIITAAIATGEVKCGPDFDEWGRAGHDFWLTRNGHGAGFWDGDWPEPFADQLTKAAKKFGESDLYTGDDGMVYEL
jgi:hypothetical protein